MSTLKQISTFQTFNKLETKVPFANWNKTKICLLKKKWHQGFKAP